MTASSIRRLTIVAATAAAAGCADSPAGPPYTPVIPTSWASGVTNPLFPLVPGTTSRFASLKPEGAETVTVEVLATTRLVNGVVATVVRDRVYLNGSLIEDTYDWYAQDSAGNVWYLGEDVKDYENGVVVSTEGSWEWGVDGALPGIYMSADPAAQVGVEYRQEYYRGHAEDWGKVIALNVSVTVPFGAFTGCLTTEDWVGVDASQPHANKTYCPSVGLVLEALTIGGGERVELVGRTP